MKSRKHDQSELLFDGSEGYIELRKSAVGIKKVEKFAQLPVEIPRIAVFVMRPTSGYDNPRFEEGIRKIRNGGRYHPQQGRAVRPPYRKHI